MSGLAHRLLPILFFTCPLVCLADECDEVLKHGVQNTYREIENGDYRKSFHKNYCMKSSTDKSTADGETLGGSYAAYSGNYGKNHSDTDSSRNSNCGGQDGQMSDQQFHDAQASVVDSQVVQAWSQCVAKHGIGVVIDGHLNDDRSFVLTYVFRPDAGTSHATVTNALVTGATCDNTVSAGTVLGIGPVVAQCTRDSPTAPVTASVNTTFDGAFFFIKTPPEPIPSDLYLGIGNVTRKVGVGTPASPQSPGGQYGLDILANDVDALPPGGTRFVEWKFYAPRAGTYNATITYSTGDPRPLRLRVNGTSAGAVATNFTDPHSRTPQNAFDNPGYMPVDRIADIVPITLLKGENSLRLDATGWPHVKQLRLSWAGA